MKYNRLLVSILAITMVFSCVPTGGAAADKKGMEIPQYNECFTFSDAKEGYESDYDLGRQNMITLGFDEELIDSLSQEEIIRYAHIESGLVNTQYIKVSYSVPTPERSAAVQTIDDGYITVNEDQLDQLKQKQEIMTKEAFEKEVAATKALQAKVVMEDKKDTIQESFLGVEQGVAATSSLNDEVRVFNNYMILSTTITKINNRKYRVAGRYEWTTEPTKRYNDIFTFGPDNATYFENSSLYAISKCNFRQEIRQPNGSITINSGNNNKEYTNYNDLEYKSGGGYGIRVKVYANGTDPYTGLPFGGNCKYTGFKGYIAGDMIVREPQNTQNMKVIVNYSQQSFSVSPSSISVTIPKSVGVSISPSNSFSIKESYISFRHPDFYEVS
jgi:hypothetical protein